MRRLKIFGLAFLICLLTTSCQKDNTGELETAAETTIDASKVTAPPYTFDTTLLGPPIEIEACWKTFRPPKGFEPIPDIDLARLRVRFLETVQRKLVTMERVLANDPRGAGIMVFSVGALFIHTDTARLFESYRKGLVESYRKENISELSFWLDDSIYVKDFRLTDSANIRHNVFGISRHGKALEIQYIMPHRSAGSLLPAVRSSIMSFARSASYPADDSLGIARDSL